MRDVQFKEEQKNDSNHERRAREEYPKMLPGFECYICGTIFASNEERKQHLQEDAHGDVYDAV